MATEIDDYKTVITQQCCIKDPMLVGGQAEVLSDGQPWRDAGGYCVVFKYRTNRGKYYAIRCWYNELSGIKERTAAISSIIKQSKLPYFAEFEYVDKAILTSKGFQAIIRMEWIEADNLKKYIATQIKTPQNIIVLAQTFYKMCCDLHHSNISHGDLQHANIKVNKNKQLILLDYDSLYHPSMGEMPDYIHGKIDYQHPARNENSIATIHIDAFSELIIYTSLLYIGNNPQIYKGNIIDSDCLIFESSDYKNFRTSSIYRELIEYSETTAFLASIIDDNLNKKDLQSIDNIEDVAKKATRKGLDIFNIKFYDLGAIYKESIDLLKNGNTKSAVEKLSRLATKKYPKAAIELGRIYVRGNGVPKDISKAVYYYKQATEYKESQFEAFKFLGIEYLKGKNIKSDYKSAKYYLDSAFRINAKDAEIAASLAELHNSSQNLNLEESLKYITIAKNINQKYYPEYKTTLDLINKRSRQKKQEKIRENITAFITITVIVIAIAGALLGLYKGGSALYSWGYGLYESGVNYDNAISAGDNFIVEGDYIKAIEEFQRALEFKKSEKKQNLAKQKIAEAQSKIKEDIQTLLGKAETIIQANKTSSKYGIVNYDDPKSMLDKVLYLQSNNTKALNLLKVLQLQKKK